MYKRPIKDRKGAFTVVRTPQLYMSILQEIRALTPVHRRTLGWRLLLSLLTSVLDEVSGFPKAPGT